MATFHLGELRITSPAFGHGTVIPERFTSEGTGASPELVFTNVPDTTRELALVCHDPDAPLTHGFTHWVLYGIPAGTTSIAEGGGTEFTQGVNDFGTVGYKGPAPPPGHGRHHYFFHLYALDSELGLPAGLRRGELLTHIDDHIIEQNRLVGSFKR